MSQRDQQEETTVNPKRNTVTVSDEHEVGTPGGWFGTRNFRQVVVPVRQDGTTIATISASGKGAEGAADIMLSPADTRAGI